MSMPGAAPQIRPIPYAGMHAGPRRVLTIIALRGLIGSPSVMINIDGAQYPRPWGTSTFEVPADRPCSVAVFQAHQSCLAMATVQPGAPAVLEYRGPAHRSLAGELGAPGTVKQRGLAVQVSLLVFMALLIVLMVGVLVVLLATMFRL